jgi:hypothetical protein
MGELTLADRTVGHGWDAVLGELRQQVGFGAALGEIAREVLVVLVSVNAPP